MPSVIKSQVECFTPSSMPFGLSYGQWTARWWQWLLSIPKEMSPAMDKTGQLAGVYQTDPDVWFLAGTLGGEMAYRNCTAAAGKAILFPVINYEINPLENPEMTETDMLKHVVEDINDILTPEVHVDGQRIQAYRVRSDPPMFTVRMPDKNLFVSRGGFTRATSDGYWVFLKYLSIGEHVISFSGSCSAGTRRVKAQYDLTVS